MNKRIPTSTRLLLTLVTDRVMDLNLAGKHWAYQRTSVGSHDGGDYLIVEITTMPRGGKFTDPEALDFRTNLEDLWDDGAFGAQTIGAQAAKDRVEKELTAMLKHLDGLLIGSMSEAPALKAVQS